MTSLPLDTPPAASASPRRPRRRIEVPYPREGQDGLFTETWYPICLSSELAKGQLIGRPFLDGKVVAFRGENGKAAVLSAYCPHIGSDLSAGKVVGNQVQCAFHHWEFDQTGACVKTEIHDRPPLAACLFNFPTAERYGLVWAFNGEEPHWQLPDVAFPDDELLVMAQEAGTFDADPVVLCCNTPDYHHFRTVHGLDWHHADPDPDTDFNWTDSSFRFKVEGTHWHNWPMSMEVGIHGTSLFFQQGYIDNKWYVFLAPMSIREVGKTFVYFVIMTHKGDGSPEAISKAQAIADWAMNMEIEFVNQDIPIVNGIHFRQGTLTRKDKPLQMFLDMGRNQPRGHVSADFIK